MGQQSLAGSLLYTDAYAAEPGAWAGAAYPAVLARAHASSVAMSGEQLFGTDIRTVECNLSLPFKGNGIGLSVNRQGTSSLQQTQAGIGWSKPLGKQISVGLRLGYFSASAQGYGTMSSPSAGLGFGMQISERCRWLVQADHVNALFMREKGSGFVIRSGLGYSFSTLCFATIEVLARQDSRTLFNIAVHYDPVERVRLRLGLATDMFLLSASFNYHEFQFSFNTGWHLALGLNYGMGMSYRFKKSAK
jgi:hypothetical protein